MTLGKPTIYLDRSLYDDANVERSKYKSKPGLTRAVVLEISKQKNEPDWLLKKRLAAFELYDKIPLPTWGPDLSQLNLDEIIYYVRPDTEEKQNWADVPADIKKTFDRLGVPEAEKTALAGVGAQYDSDVIYHNIQADLKKQGVIFTNMDTAVHEYPELVQKYFMTQCVPINDHKFVMLHAAVWSGGTFIYVPKDVKVDLPLQAYFRMNAKSGGQFEHTLIIVDEGAEIQYIEGCFIAGTNIVTKKGLQKIEKIKVGDIVKTHTGNWEKVYHTQVRPHTGDLYTISYYGDQTVQLKVTNEHPFWIVKRERANEQNKNWKPEWCTPPELGLIDYLVMPIDNRVKTQNTVDVTVPVWSKVKRQQILTPISIPSTPEFFRLAGYFLAEGSISSGAYLNFSFGEHEPEYIADVVSLLKKLFNIKKVYQFKHKTNHGVSVVVCSTTLCRVFEQLFSKGNANKQIAEWVQMESLEKQRELLKGYFRGDGNYYQKNHNSGFKEMFRINTTSSTLARQTRDLLLRHGIVAFLNLRPRKKEGRRDMYTVGISGRYLKKFGDIVGISIPEKMNNHKRASRFFTDGKYVYFPIKSITKKIVKKKPVYNFSVEKDESYVANGVIAHNCSAPRYTTNSLHAGCVEIFVHKNARARYFSIENWSKNTYNLNTKRALVDENGVIEWINGNMGSGVTMLYPCSILRGRGARSDSLGIAFAGPGQNQDTGSKAIHCAPDTNSTIRAKSISAGGGISTYRGFVKVTKPAINSSIAVNCDALLIDDASISNTHPSMKIDNNEVDIVHEARVGKIGDTEIFYLQSRGLSEEQAMQLVVAGFIEPIVKALPLEYAVELNKLIELEMEGAIG